MAETFNLTFSLAGVSYGEHTITVETYDYDGNLVSTDSVTVEVAPPVLGLVQAYATREPHMLDLPEPPPPVEADIPLVGQLWPRV